MKYGQSLLLVAEMLAQFAGNRSQYKHNALDIKQTLQNVRQFSNATQSPGNFFTPNLLICYSEANIRELKVLLEFIIDGHSLKNIDCADDTILTANTDRKLQKLLYKPEKVLSIVKRQECMAIERGTSQNVNYKLKMSKSRNYRY